MLQVLHRALLCHALPALVWLWLQSWQPLLPCLREATGAEQQQQQQAGLMATVQHLLCFPLGILIT
jgi:hypothetical protein